MRVLHPRSPCEISRGIGAPVATECNDFRLKIHVIYSFYVSVALEFIHGSPPASLSDINKVGRRFSGLSIFIFRLQEQPEFVR